MNKLFIHLFVFVFTMAGCASWLASPYIGNSLDSFITSHGLPAYQYQATNGRTIYFFRSPCKENIGYQEESVMVNPNNVIEEHNYSRYCSDNPKLPEKTSASPKPHGNLHH